MFFTGVLSRETYLSVTKCSEAMARLRIRLCHRKAACNNANRPNSLCA